MLVLGIESSCDETAAAVVENGTKVLSSAIATQEEAHARFGGVVPEIASRNHIAAIVRVMEKALADARTPLDRINGIAVTKGPGLIGPLLVGLSFAKAVAYARGIPFVGVHHIEGHLTAALIGPETPAFPLVGLVASGGHTSLYRMPSAGTYELIGQSRDDAAGEAFDKVAKLCNLGFPGGPAIDRAAEGGNPEAIRFPRASVPKFDFSFSGLKTAVAQWIREHGQPQGKPLADLAASFQEAVVDALTAKLFEAAEREGVENIVVCGGVARNRRLRKQLEDESAKRRLRLSLAPLDLCTDNAAMIAAAGYARLARGESDDIRLNARATIPIIAS